MGNKLNEYRQSMGSNHHQKSPTEAFRFEEWSL